MKKIEAIQILQKNHKRIFHTSDLGKLFSAENTNTLNKQIKGLIEAGVLTRIIKGFYYLTSNKPTDFELANILYRPSYISLESALNYYGILVQSPQQITSVTTKLTRTIENAGKVFSYSHLTQKYFNGYQTVDGFLIAIPEKALVDTMFFCALGKTSFPAGELHMQSIDKGKARGIADRIDNKVFKKYFASIRL
ncbi:MAG TPA: hypothetical protein VGA53_03215 [Candidatus Paceibacterota bacterium]